MREPLTQDLDSAVLRTFFADGPFGVAVLTPEGRYVRVNAEFAKANGPTPEEHEGLLIEDVLGEGKEQVRALIDEVVRTRRSAPSVEVDVVDHQGVPRSWRTVWLPALDEDGELEGVIAVGIEVTEQRAAERAQAAAEQRSALLAATGELLDAGLDVDEVGRRLVRLLVRDAASWAALHLVRPDGQIRFAGVAARDPDHEAQLHTALADFTVTRDQPRGAGWVIAHGEPQLVPAVDVAHLQELGGDQRFVDALSRGSTGDAAAVPLLARGRVLGALSISREAGADRVLPLEDLVAVVGRAALALDNALLYERQSQIALTLQRALLPPVRHLPADVDVAVRYVPGVSDLEVGGDFYDVLDLVGGAVGLVIGDVMGRGLRAAAVMGQVRAALRAYAQLGLPPAQVLSALDALVTSLDETVVVTATYAVLDVERGLLTVASAGHLPPVLRRPDGTVDLVEVALGSPLGAGAPALTAAEVAVPPGSSVVLCTDGLVEDRLRDIDDGLRGLVDAVAAGPRDVEDLADAVLVDLGRAHGHDDDVALLVARTRERVAPEKALVLPASPASVPEARRWLRRLTAADTDRSEVAQLLVSELVTNAVLHTGTTVRVSALVGAGGVRVEVADGSRALPVLPTGGELEATTGRGTRLVADLSDRWGVQEDAHGKVVWFELGSPPERTLEEWHAPSPETTRQVVVPQVPLELLVAALRHQDAALRELALRPGSVASQARLAEARSVLASGVASALAVASRGEVDLAFAVPADVGAESFRQALEAHHAAERLAAEGQLLTPPALPEVSGILTQVLGEIALGLAAGPPSRELEVPPGHVLVAEDHRILGVDPVLEERLGWPPGGLVGLRLSVLVPARHLSAHAAGFTRVVTTGEARVLGQDVHVPVRLYDGSEAPAVVRVHHDEGHRTFLGSVTLQE